jgi:iron complex outermembrane recepter protein
LCPPDIVAQFSENLSLRLEATGENFQIFRRLRMSFLSKKTPQSRGENPNSKTLNYGAKFVFVGLLLFAAQAAFAQTAVSLRGRVVDANGASVPNAAVLLKSAASGQAQTVSTNDAGEFEFAAGETGNYQISVSANGFAPFAENVRIGEKRELEIKLVPRGFDEFVTIVGADETYRASSATTAMRADIPLRDTPQSIQVITQQTIQDQNAITAETAVRNVSGVTVPNTSGGRAEDFTIRGFTSSGNTYRDGIRNDFNSNRAHAELSNVERIEVLKGPASILYGRLDPSGVVNYVTKKPRTDRYYSFQTTVGSFGLVRPQIDLGGAFNESKTILYRFNGAYERNKTFRDFNERERFFAAPALTFVLGDKTSLNFEAEALKGTGLIDRGLIAVGTGVAPIPISTYLGDPAIPYKYQQARASLALSHFFTPDVNLRSAFRVNFNKANYDSRQPRVLAADNRTLSLSNNDADQSLQTFYWQTDLNWKFNAGGIRHNVVAGTDLSYESFASQTLTSANRNIDIYNPVYNFAPAPFALAGLFKNIGRSAGVYAQNLIALRDDLKLLVGGRFDYYYQNNDNRFRRTVTQSYSRAFTPRVGIVYQPVEPVSVYASYSRSFQPINGANFFGEPFVPETGEQYEAGVKFDFLKRRLSATAAVFQIVKANVLATDPNDPRNTVQIGEQRSRGFELDLNAQPVRGWNAILTYAFTDAVITNDTTRNAAGEFFLVGNQLQGTPRQTGSFWTSYEFDKGAPRGFGAGAGIFLVGRRFGDNSHTFTVPGYGRVDTAVFYKIYSKEKLRYRVAFNLNNVFDKLYYSGVRGRYSIEPGAPRNGQLTFQAIF